MAVTTGKQDENVLMKHIIAIHSFVDFIQIREKQWNADQVFDFIGKLIGAGVPKSKIIVNHHVDVAISHGCFGVQLTGISESPAAVKQRAPHLWVSSSIHSIKELDRNQEADMYLFGHVYETSCKQGVAPRGLDSLIEILNDTNKPVYAIGGIALNKVDELFQLGIAGIAVMSGIFAHPEPRVIAQHFRQCLMNEGWVV